MKSGMKLGQVLALAWLLAACAPSPQTADNAASADKDHDSVPAKDPVDVAGEPPLETDPALLDAALVCTDFTHADQNPVLLVHGTFTNASEQYDWTYLPLLQQRGFDVCTVTYPDRGMGDQQISAEYVVYALRKIHALTHKKVEMIGHSQGAGMPRWALRWWPSARDAVEDFVLQAGPNHGTQVADPSGGYGSSNPVGMPAGFYQFQPGSKFIAAVNSCDETPGSVDYTSVYTQFDELVQPVTPVPTAALEWGQDNKHVTNVLIQDVCPGRFVDHVAIGTTDRVAFELTLDAITHKGPADVSRVLADLGALCSLADENVSADTPAQMAGIPPKDQQYAFPPDSHMATEEPPLKDYVTTDCD